MRKASLLAVTVGVVVVATAAAGSAGLAGAAPVRAGRPAAAGKLPAVPLNPGVIRGQAGPFKRPPTTAQCESKFRIACYGPGQIQAAYGLPKLYARGIAGAGQTVVIVDSFGSPTIRRDLRVFDKTYGLPAPPSFRIIQPAGKVPPFKPTSDRIGWAFETSLDVQYAHTVAPGANILLVETPVSETEGTAGFPQIVKAEEYVINHHLGGVISQSFGSTEQDFSSAQALLRLRGAYRDARAKHITVLASSGDSGAADVKLNESTYYLFPVTSWPDSDPLVTGVGGTQLHLNAAGRHTAPDNVWNDTYNVPTNRFIAGNKGPNPLAGGGGKSVIFARPSYQNGVKSVVGDQRGVPDISMSAACNGAVNVHLSFRGLPAGWYQVCGTSEASPLFAGVVALADQVAGHPLGLINPALYKLSREHAPGIVDITSGNNTVSFRQGGKLHTVKGFRARPGYDLASGVGTIYAPAFVPELAHLAG
jgi:subtilase family serine protease